ncbi:MAG: hypothetical protein AB7W59_01005 [Acidimicrobiia bacterium]
MSRIPAAAHPPVLWWWASLVIVRVGDHVDRWRTVSWPSVRDGAVVAGPGWAVRVAAVVDLATSVLLLGAIGLCALPWLRTRRLHRAWDLDPPPESLLPRLSIPPGPVASLLRADLATPTTNTAITYPNGFRPAVAVLAPFFPLSRRDPEAAGFVLRHELAHAGAGDHLLSGAGSPLRALVRVIVPVGVAMAVVTQLIPDRLGEARAQTVVFVGNTLTLALGLLAALWVAELEADRAAAEREGARAAARSLGAGLDAGHRGLTLSHPPQRLRQWLVVRWANPVAAAGLLLFYPLTVLARWGLLVAVALLSYSRVPDTSVSMAWSLFGDAALASLARSGRELVVFGVLVIAWPVLRPAWERLWLGAPGRSIALLPGNLLGGALCIGGGLALATLG